MKLFTWTVSLVATIAAAPLAGTLSLAHPNGEAARTQIDPVFLDRLTVREARKLDGLTLYVSSPLTRRPSSTPVRRSQGRSRQTPESSGRSTSLPGWRCGCRNSKASGCACTGRCG
jgi:hypothetical protein